MIQEALKLKLKAPGFRRPWGTTKTNIKGITKTMPLKRMRGPQKLSPMRLCLDDGIDNFFSKGFNKELSSGSFRFPEI